MNYTYYKVKDMIYRLPKNGTSDDLEAYITYKDWKPVYWFVTSMSLFRGMITEEEAFLELL